MTEKLIYTVPEAADLLSLSRTTVYDLVLSKRLESVKVGTARRIPADALTKYVASIRVPLHAA